MRLITKHDICLSPVHSLFYSSSQVHIHAGNRHSWILSHLGCAKISMKTDRCSETFEVQHGSVSFPSLVWPSSRFGFWQVKYIPYGSGKQPSPTRRKLEGAAKLQLGPGLATLSRRRLCRLPGYVCGPPESSPRLCGRDTVGHSPSTLCRCLINADPQATSTDKH
ncbi:hypothetical protein BV25DRAFT_351372 [Artomyces pyxidatus]|uniref:Uncharacterized protein n=1 Tax=Artomyces pyxidatus TaxID=48021 RepID=A0ACB8T629_9AGAM|nr:hypothetical protein BV25DRAFT_351372 [Artomyces pyxidatus]